MGATTIDRVPSAPAPVAATLAETIKDALDAVFLQLDHVTALMSELEACYRSGARRAKPRHLVIFGLSGSGKTRLLEKFAARRPDEERPDRTLFRVLRATIPSSPTPRKIVQALLIALKSPFAARGNDEEQMHHLKTLVDKCEVHIVLLDEVSHLVDRGRERTHYKYGDALKEIVDELKLPFVLTGIPRLQKLFDVNEQLRGRFGRRRHIRPFSITRVDHIAEFRGVVTSFQNKLIGLDCIDLSSKQVLPLVFFACNGLLRPLVELLKEAAELACATEKRRLDLNILITAFQNTLWNDAPSHRNPFSDDFDTLPLTSDGEPYAAPVRDL